MASVYTKTNELRDRLERAGIVTTFPQANVLRRAELTLQRWAEMECGDGNEFSSWSIERDEATGKPYRCVYPHKGQMRRYPVPDRERGAIKRVAELCKELGIHYWHQTDPRGCALYVSREPLTGTNYSNGVGCYGGK